MGKPFSLDLRERICAYVAKGNSAQVAGFLAATDTEFRLQRSYINLRLFRSPRTIAATSS